MDPGLQAAGHDGGHGGGRRDDEDPNPLEGDSGMSRLPDEASFLKDVAHHKMTVLRDDGLDRHVQFRVGTSWHMSFSITTWPGYLCFSGDMGCFVFARLPDMLEFFRFRITDQAERGLFIDPGYWAQKLQAVDRNSGVKEYSSDLFRRRIAEWLDEAEASPDLREAVEDEVLAYADDNEHEAMRAATEFDFKGRRPFNDFYEVSVKEYTYRFMWACYALAWAVRQYDAQTEVGAAKVMEGVPA